MAPPALVVIHPCACEAYGLRLGSAFPVGAVVITADGTTIVVMADGQVAPRPSPLPWTRPSWAAIPTMTYRFNSYLGAPCAPSEKDAR